MRTTTARPANGTHRLVLLADGGSLADFQERPEIDGKKIDFNRLPVDICGALEKAGSIVTSEIEDRFFFNVGSEKAGTFLARIGEQWTVTSFPLTVAKYDRATVTGGEKHRFRLRFHAYIGYVLGLITAAPRPDPDSKVLVGILSDDPHILPCMANARGFGIDARLVWWQSALSNEVSFMAADRYEVPTVPLIIADATSQRRDTTLDHLLGRAR